MGGLIYFMKDNTRKTLQLYWQFAMKYKIAGLLVVLGVTFVSVINVIIPLFFKNFFDVLTGGSISDDVVAKLIGILVIIAGLNLAEWVGWRIATFSITYFESKMMADLSNHCFSYLHKHSFSFFNNNFVGTLVKRVQWFTKAFEGVTDRLLFDLIPLVINIVFITIVLYTKSLILGSVLVVWLIIFLFVNYCFSKYKLKYDIKRSEMESETSAYLADTVTNNNNVKLFNAYRRELKGFANLNAKLQKIRRFSWDLGNVFESIQGLLMIFLNIGLFYVAIKLWQKGILTIGDFVLLQAYLINIFMRIWSFGRIIVKIYENLADAEEMTIVLNTPHEINDVRDAKDLKVSQAVIEFKDVSFHYHKTRTVLKKLNLKIKPGEKIALIGPSGAGKTTIAKLLLRMHDITSGKILINDQRISRVTQESLWQSISLVPQDPILFHRPLIDNIRYGNAKATKKEVELAAKAAHCHDFINDLDKGYNTYVGERGIKLSGGERQRVAIARAILHNAPILVLDEATSSLDSESELLIQDALDKLMKNKTVIVIAHRLSTIKKMDRIIVIDQGGIIEQGTHDELTKKTKGVYKKLWQLQAGGFI